jgi:hypothetical protein
MEKEKPQRIRIIDLTGIAPWLDKNGIPIDLEKEDSGRVVGYALATDEVYRLMAEYQAGPMVQLLDFLAFQRRLRGRLLDLRDGRNGRRGNGRDESRRS